MVRPSRAVKSSFWLSTVVRDVAIKRRRSSGLQAATAMAGGSPDLNKRVVPRG